MPLEVQRAETVDDLRACLLHSIMPDMFECVDCCDPLTVLKVGPVLLIAFVGLEVILRILCTLETEGF